MQKIEVVVLAAGYGKRMQSEVPKVLIPLHGKPLLGHVLDAVTASGVCDHPVVVVGQRRELVMETFGPAYRYVTQEEQLGTGHAVLSTAPMLEGKTEHIMVLYGDQPFTSPETVRTMAEYHMSHGGAMTMATVALPDFEGWRKAFYSFGRIVRDAQGKLSKILYGKNLTEAELAITEVDPAYFCFRADWLWPRLRSLKNENSHAEYYLTDLVGIAAKEGTVIETIQIPQKKQ